MSSPDFQVFPSGRRVVGRVLFHEQVTKKNLKYDRNMTEIRELQEKLVVNINNAGKLR